VVLFLIEDCCGSRPEVCAPLIESLTPCCPGGSASGRVRAG
jgi:ArsR family transcriptional regulator, arsenate/arsenite/antimonite-responsive transcriptional repressor